MYDPFGVKFSVGQRRDTTSFFGMWMVGSPPLVEKTIFPH
jgi:hypothetical protein